MIQVTIRLANEHQDRLRAEAAQRRRLAPASRSSLHDRLASAASIVRSAFGGPEIAPGSVFPATH